MSDNNIPIPTPLTPNESALAARFLREHAERAYNAGCNDIDLDTTPENVELCRELLANTDLGEWPGPDSDETRRFTAPVPDWMILNRLAHRLERLAAVTLVAAILACTPIHGAQTLEAVSAGACIAGDAATVAGQSWGAIVSAVACALERHAARRVERQGRELADARDLAAIELELAFEACDPEPTPGQRARVEAALVEYWGTP